MTLACSRVASRALARVRLGSALIASQETYKVAAAKIQARFGQLSYSVGFVGVQLSWGSRPRSERVVSHERRIHVELVSN